MRAPERAAHGLARGVDRVRIDVLADLARDVGFGRQAHGQRGESVVDPAGARVLDQRAKRGSERLRHAQARVRRGWRVTPRIRTRVARL